MTADLNNPVTDYVTNYPSGCAIVAKLKLIWPGTPYSVKQHAQMFDDLSVGLDAAAFDRMLSAMQTFDCKRAGGPTPPEMHSFIRAHAPTRSTMPSQKREPRGKRTPKEATWAAVMGVLGVRLAGGNWMDVIVTKELPEDSLLTNIQILSLVQNAEVPHPDVTAADLTLAHRLAYSEVRRAFEEIFGELGNAPGRTPHAYCACHSCERYVNRYPVGMSA